MGRKRTEIIIETERVLFISSRRSADTLVWCEPCGRLLPMLTAEETATVLRLSVEEVLRMLEDGQLHSVQLTGGRLRICPNSLLR